MEQHHESLNYHTGDWGALASASKVIWAGYCYSDKCCEYTKEALRKQKTGEYAMVLVKARKSRVIKTNPSIRVLGGCCPKCNKELIWKKYNALTSDGT